MTSSVKKAVGIISILVILMSEDGLSFQICRDSDYPDDKKTEIESLRKDWKVIYDGIQDFNKKLHGFSLEEFWIFMRNREDKVVGGISCFIVGDWLHVGLLWVEESFRSKGKGTKLLKMAEAEAVKRGCKLADLDTVSSQAEFYEKNVYTIFATLENCPDGFTKYFMKKDLP